AGCEVAITALARSTFKPISTSSRFGSIAVFTRSMHSAHCWGSAGRRWLRPMTGCTPVHGNIQNAVAKAWRASSELGTDKIVTKSGALGCKPDKHGYFLVKRSFTTEPSMSSCGSSTRHKSFYQIRVDDQSNLDNSRLR